MRRIWFSKLADVKGKGRLYISKQCPLYRLFTYFSDYIELYRHIKCSGDNNLYEVVLNTPQKPRFDIDLSRDDIGYHEDVFRNVVMSLIGCFHDLYSIDLNPSRDILVYTSHGKDKRSYHIVVDNYAHYNNREAEWLYKQVIGRIDSKYHKYVDGSVYRSVQQFRLLWSEKLGSNRPKVFQEEWYIDANNKVVYQYPEDIYSKEHKEILQLSSSLLSFTDGCKILPDKVEYSRSTTTRVDNISLDNIPHIVDIVRKYIQSNDLPFKIRKIDGDLIVLDRIRPSQCWSCGREHDHENPYIKICGNSVIFCCRRGRGVVIGTISSESDRMDIPEEEKNNKMFNCNMYM